MPSKINPENLISLITIFAIRFGIATLIFLFGLWFTKRLHKLILKILKKSNLDPTVISFLGNLSYAALITIIILMVLAELGLRTTSIVALLGAAGLAVGLALQGSLSNFAAGIILVVFRYFKVDDLIEGAGIIGYVEGIKIFTTTVRTLDNRLVIIPNAKLIEDNITNYYAKPYLRIDLVIGVSYSDNIDKVRQVIAEIIDNESRILDYPQATIHVGELGDNSVNFYVRPWVKTHDYIITKFDLIENIKKRFDLEGITIPFPQRDLYLYSQDK
nr:mechanosensitive ion channel domain-containing protein [Xenococcus sp. PCC 7305]